MRVLLRGCCTEGVVQRVLKKGCCTVLGLKENLAIPRLRPARFFIDRIGLKESAPG